MDNQQRITKMHQLLSDALNPSQLDIQDDSHKHIGHAGAQSGAGHFTITIAADEFQQQSLVACHRRIYDILDDLIGPEIHALSIHIVTASAEHHQGE